MWYWYYYGYPIVYNLKIRLQETSEIVTINYTYSLQYARKVLTFHPQWMMQRFAKDEIIQHCINITNEPNPRAYGRVIEYHYQSTNKVLISLKLHCMLNSINSHKTCIYTFLPQYQQCMYVDLPKISVHAVSSH